MFNAPQFSLNLNLLNIIKNIYCPNDQQQQINQTG